MRRTPLARTSHGPTAEARDKPTVPSLRLLTVLNGLSNTPPRAARPAPRTDGLLTYFASPRGEESGLAVIAPAGLANADAMCQGQLLQGPALCDAASSVLMFTGRTA